MNPRLELGSVCVDDFDTYKHHPALLASTSHLVYLTQVLNHRGTLELELDGSPEADVEMLTAREAEAMARAEAGKLLLFNDLVAQMPFHPASDRGRDL